MNDARTLMEQWQRNEQVQIVGWDSSFLADRITEEYPPWAYIDRAREILANASSLLDMDTGGGERLLELRDDWPSKVVVTEEHPPNNRLVHERLAPLGVSIFDCKLSITDPMPFASNEFAVVLNRHSAFNPDEVARILAPGGRFLTQQVHGRHNEDLQEAFSCKPQWPFLTPGYFSPRLEAAGLVINEVQEWSGYIEFADVGAIVSHLSNVPWTVPGFSVATHLNYLLALQARVDLGEALVFVSKSYLIEASKPASNP